MQQFLQPVSQPKYIKNEVWVRLKSYTAIMPLNSEGWDADEVNEEREYTFELAPSKNTEQQSEFFKLNFPKGKVYFCSRSRLFWEYLKFETDYFVTIIQEYRETGELIKDMHIGIGRQVSFTRQPE